ncbi:MAG: DASS family sodium-coupled anion symporter [Sphingomonadales bacterium]|nr:DASS family sodium-coupled anion symporter [Sphingomonadales bacterium]
MGQRNIFQTIGFYLGPALALVVLLSSPPEGLSQNAWYVVALGSWMAIWWGSEAIPIPVTSLLPLIFLPLVGVGDLKAAAIPYSSPIIFLLLGGFIIAMAMQRWNLHQRIALTILSMFGSRPTAIIGGFMAATALLSMWVSNTATTLMMIPIALSVGQAIVGPDDKRNPFVIALLLGIAYSASIGGMGTPIGTPPNVMMVGYLRETLNIEVSFLQWMTFGIPVVLLMTPAAWFVLTKLYFKIDNNLSHGGGVAVEKELAKMGNISAPERRVAIIFAFIAFAWVFRTWLDNFSLLQNLSDTGIAIIGAVVMFLVPSGSKTDPGSVLLNWEWAVRIPWGVLLLFGGGLSLAAAVSSTGLAVWLGDSLSVLTTFHLFILMAAIITMVVFLTELTSNTATTATLLPVLGAIAITGGIDPMLLAAPAAVAASCAFMLPVATAPNAIVFSGGRVHIPDMAGAGFRLNIIAIIILSSLSYLLIPVIFT